ncbi:MAG: ABC transporter permease [Streptosporangiaceae bacterium]|jgi:ABC-2 type transport system permease protein
MNAAAITASQVRYVNKAYWRSPASAFFALAYPLMFLVVFTSIFRNSRVVFDGREVNEATFYVPAMAALAVITVCFNNVAVAVTFQRDSGVLKRVNGTPLPSASFFGARIVHAVLVSALLVIITAAFGRAFYHADIPTGLTLLRVLAMLAVGAASFCALGFAISSVIPSADASLPIVNAIILPLLFLSGVFIPLGNNPAAWMTWIGRIFPVRHFLSGMQAGFLGAPFNWTDVLVVAAWGLAGLLIAIRFFRWEPRTG